MASGGDEGASRAVNTAGGPLRLLAVTHSLSGGGAERFVSNLATGLDRERFAPEVCLATGRASYPLPGDVPLTSLGYRGVRDLPRAIRALRRLIVDRAPDLVLSNVLSTNCLTGAALAGLERRPPWVARIGNAPEVAEPPLQRWWARRVYPRARLLVCNSRGMVNAFARRYPELRDRVKSLANPTDFAALDRLAAGGPIPRAGDGPVLLAVGRLTRQKRPDLMLAALAEVRRRPGLASTRLQLCGEGPLAGALARRARRLGLGDSVELLGFVDNPFALMRAADLYLLTSDFEGLPNALIEAQGVGLPAVATRCPHGPDEIIEDGVTGLLAPVGDAAAIAAAVADLLADSERRRRMAAAAAVRARRLYGAETLLPRWQQILAEAAAPPAPGRGGERC